MLCNSLIIKGRVKSKFFILKEYPGLESIGVYSYESWAGTAVGKINSISRNLGEKCRFFGDISSFIFRLIGISER